MTVRLRLLAAGCLALLALGLVGPAVADDAAFERLIEQASELGKAGRFAPALELYDEALALAESEQRMDWRGRTFRERGLTYLYQGAIEDARTDLEASIAIFDERGETVEAAMSRLRIVSMLARGRVDKAQELFARAESDLRQAGDEDALRFAQLFGARIQMGQGDYQGVIDRLEPLRDFYTAEGDTARLADTLNLLAYSLQQAGRLEDARDAYQGLLGAAFEESNQQMLSYAYCNLGDVESELGSPQAAEESLDVAMDSLDDLRAEVPGGVEERMTFLDVHVSAYDGKIALLVDRGEPAAALGVAERYHAKSLREELAAPRTSLDRSTLTEEQRSVLHELIDLQHRLISTGLDEKAATRLRELEDVWARDVRSERRRNSTEVAPVKLRDASDLQSTLPAKTAILAYWVHPERSFVWVLLPDRFELLQVPTGRQALRDSVRRYLEPIRDRVVAEDLALRGGIAEHLELGNDLYRRLIEPAAPLLSGIEHLIVIPDDYLWHLPFEALVQATGHETSVAKSTLFNEYASARFLVEDFSVLYAPSASVWAELSERRPRGKGLIAIAPSLEGSDAARERGWSLGPLPGARKEAIRVAKLIDHGQTLLDREATEQRVKSSLPDYRFLHFATHGYLHPERPQLSGLFLWPDEAGARAESPDDGLFQGFEVRPLDLESELVSLAACNSGLGQLSRAEGIVGVARSFLVAGSRNVLVSLWPVDDRASSSLIERFYRELGDSSTLPHALRAAKLALIERSTRDTVTGSDRAVSYAHPYFWATYVLIGGDNLTPARLD